MYLRAILICIFFQSPALAETISTLTLDWNNDGFDDVARLDRSRTIAGRADLLLFEGSANGAGSELIQVASDFARAPHHHNMDLQVLLGAALNQFTVVETGKIAGPEFWTAETSIRYDGGVFFVDKHRIDQLPARFWEGGSTTCLVNFQDKLFGGGDGIMSEVIPIDANPMPLVYWTAETFANLVQSSGLNDCDEYQETYALFMNSGQAIEDELMVDWNNDGDVDRLVLWNTYVDYNLGLYTGDSTGAEQLRWVARNLGQGGSKSADLRITPGRNGVVEITAFGANARNGAGTVDTAVRLSSQNGAPIVTELAVWEHSEDSDYIAECRWDFVRSREISSYSKQWYDDPDHPSVYTLSEWENIDLGEIIYDCRP